MTRHSSLRSILTVLACSLLVGGAAACGGSDDTSTPAGSADDAGSRQAESGDAV